VDLKGQLSNPSRAVGSLAGQGSRVSEHVDDSPQTADSESQHEPSSSASEEKGRLSNPAQRRLTDTGIDALVAEYEAGSTIELLASRFGIHRTTVMTHLERRGISRRSPRRLTDEIVAGAAHCYTTGETLAEIAANLGIAPSTLTRELRLAGITIRRRGRPPSD
jgi:AraC-like DNA-binding protein